MSNVMDCKTGYLHGIGGVNISITSGNVEAGVFLLMAHRRRKVCVMLALLYWHQMGQLCLESGDIALPYTA